MHIYTNVFIYVCICVYIYICIALYAQLGDNSRVTYFVGLLQDVALVYMYVCMYLHVYIYICVRIYLYIYIFR